MVFKHLSIYSRKIKNMKRIKAKYSTFARGFPGWYYLPRYSDEDLDLKILFSFLTLLTNTSHVNWQTQETEFRTDISFEEYKEILLSKKGINSDDGDFIHNTAFLISENTVYIASSFTSDEEEVDSRSKFYPYLTKKEFQDYKYYMDKDNFLDVLKNFLYHATEQTPYIILYKDYASKVHCKKYHPTKEELKEWSMYGG